MTLRLTPLLLASALIVSSPAMAAATAQPQSSFKAKVTATEDALMADPPAALRLAREAGRMAAAMPKGQDAAVAQATASWLEAEALIGLNKIDEAARPATTAARVIGEAAIRSKLAGDVHRTLGAIAASKGDVQAALRHNQQAHRIFQAAGETRSQAIILLDIGQIYWDAGDYQRVLSYFRQAEELMPADDAGLKLALYNGRGEVLRSMKRFGDAERQYELALAQARKLKSNMLQVRLLANLGNAQVRAGKLDAAERSARRGLALAGSEEAAEWRPFLYEVLAQASAQRGDLPRAAAMIDRAFAGQSTTGTSMPFRETHALAADVLQKLGRNGEALAHFRAFQRLDKEAQQLIATNSAQLMAAQFDFANQDLRISQLKRGQLERDIKLERQRSRYRTNLFAGLAIAGAIVLAMLLFGFFSIRRSRNQVRAANHELAGSNQALEKALKAKSEFLATTSHEIRTPLNGILGMTQVLLADPRVAMELREKIEVVHGAGETMQALVDDILDVAKMEHGQLTLVRERVDLGRLLEDAARLWRMQAEAKGLELRLAVSDLPAAVMTDGGRLRQIAFNLLSNAVKFTPAGHVEMRARTQEEGGRSWLTLEVEDSGIGIAPEHHDGIFEMFSQVDGGTTRQFSGTGLGLAISRSLADALGGSITLRSAPGGGSTFTVHVPVDVATSEAASATGAIEGALGVASVLLIESNPALQGMLRVVLTPQVAALEVTASFDEALTMLERGGIDLVIADCGSVAGPEERLAALVHLAERSRSVGCHLSLLHADDGGPAIADLFAVGADQIIVKPIQVPELLAALEALYGDDPPMLVAPTLLGDRMAA